MGETNGERSLNGINFDLFETYRIRKLKVDISVALKTKQSLKISKRKRLQEQTTF